MLVTLTLVNSLWAHSIPGVTVVRVIEQEGKKVELLTNAKGLSIYTFDPDGANESSCYESCTVTWPPIILTPAEAQLVSDDFGLANRKEGSLQLTFDSRPLYLFVGDKKPGDIRSDGLGGVWHLTIDEE